MCKGLIEIIKTMKFSDVPKISWRTISYFSEVWESLSREGGEGTGLICW